MKQTLKKFFSHRTARKLLSALFWLLVWQGIALAVGSELLFPGPLPVLKRFFLLLGQGSFYATAGLSLLRVGAGYLAAMLLGTLLAALAGSSALLRELLFPPLAVIRATPVASFILLAILWLTRSLVPAFIAFLMVLPMAFANVLEGIRRTDPLLLEMTKAFRLPFKKVLAEIYIPGVLPHFYTACLTGLGFAWKAGVAAEVLCTPSFSIGKQLYESKLYFEIPDLFAWTLLVILMSVLLETLLSRALKALRKEGRT